MRIRPGTRRWSYDISQKNRGLITTCRSEITNIPVCAYCTHNQIDIVFQMQLFERKTCYE